MENEGRLFTIKTGKSVIIKNLIEVIKPYIKECNIRITPEYIKISAIDLAENSITYVKLDAEKFGSYFCEQTKTICVEIVTLYKAIKSANRRDAITLYMDSNDPDKLGIQLSDPFQGKVKDYKINLLELDNDKITELKPMTFSSVINMPSLQFQQIIKDIHLLEGKNVEIKSIDKQLIFSSTDGIAEFRTSITEIDDVVNKEQKTLLQANGDDLKTVKFSKHSSKIIQGTFKMVYLMNFIKASHLCDSMNILLDNDCPLVLEYYVADLGKLKLILMQN
jgi:proliferating cell nuclear antigen PCNA